MTRLLSILSFSLMLPFMANAQEASLVYPDFDRYENFQDVYIAPGGRGFAISTCDNLYLTTNDGSSWSSRDLPDNVVSLQAVTCAPGTNCNQVYLSTNRGIYRSTNGGSSWLSATPNRFTEMDFSLPGVIHAYEVNGVEFYRSDDDGVSWTEAATPERITDDMLFTSPSLYVMVGDSSFYRSTDGGATWTEPYQFPNKATLITTDDSGNYYVETRDNDIFKSEDGGLTWTQKAENAHQFTAWFDMFKDAEDSLHIISFNGIRFSSGDDGLTWGQVGPSVLQRYNRFRRGEGRLFAAGDGLTILKGNEDYTDMSAQIIEGSVSFREIVFQDANNGYAFGEQGEIFRTTNGGGSWAKSGQNDTWQESRPKVAPDGAIYGIENITSFIRSTNGGASWTTLTAANNAVNNSRLIFDVLPNGEVVVMSSERTVRLAPDNSVVFAADGGNSVINGGTFDLKMINADLGFIIRWARSEMYRTEDGGQTWTTIEPFGGNNFFNWFEVEDDNNFFIGNGSNSWRTTDAGQTWVEYFGFTSLGRFFVGEDLYGFDRNRLNRSRDNGDNWEVKFETCSLPLDMVRRPGTNEIFLTYSNGIERLNLDEILSPVRQPRPEATALRAVPNPTNGVVQISIPEAGANRGLAELYDISGRRVEVSVSQTSGQLSLDLIGLQSGIYLLKYTAPTGEVFQTRLVRK